MRRCERNGRGQVGDESGAENRSHVAVGGLASKSSVKNYS
jgi:hypothetical protein